jgi:hypothetical protein
MGLNFNYLLYFKREHLWDALQGVVEIAKPYDHARTTIHFPDHDLFLPIMTGFQEGSELQHDQAELNFVTSLIFEEDKAILDYLLNNGDEGVQRSPPETVGINRVAIGFIYLTVFADLSQHRAFKKPTDLVLIKFGTTGTHMSMLFEDSKSIRKTFINLLERYHGVSGIFDREVDYGQLFWFKGKQVETNVLSVYMLPEEIEEMLS